MLVALGVDLSGAKEVLAVRVAGQESLETWTVLVADLKKRGVNKVELVV